MTRKTTLAKEISATLNRINNAQDPSDAWEDLTDLLELCPSGSGIDCGTKIDEEESSPNKLVLLVGYHHMDENGFYCGWNTYKITVEPSFDGIVVNGECIDSGADFTRYDEETGEEYDDTEWQEETTLEYLCDTYHHALTEPITYSYDNGKRSWQLSCYAKETE